jgi:ethanolamine ammonia-lyase large subunit
MIVNDVAGFIGPEVFRTGRQLLRACLEDTVMAKLHGITMGLDVCSTFHMGIDPFELMALTQKIVKDAAPAYLMAVAGKADPMLGILTTSYREHPRLRRLSGRQISSAMKERLISLNAIDADGSATGSPEKTSMLYARYMKAGDDKRTIEELEEVGLKTISRLKEKGCDLGYGSGPDLSDPPLVTSRLNSIYTHARNALYATLDASVIRDCCPNNVGVSTNAADREDYLAHPASGELINDRDSNTFKRLYTPDKAVPQIMFVISDGLNADAVNENLRDVLPELRWQLKSAGYHVGEIDVIIKNGRARAGYHAAGLVGPDVLIHLIGERPGTGLNQLSVYMTYGKDVCGNPCWSPDMDHSLTTAICSIHKRGKTPKSAINDIMKCTLRMFELKCSGVSLGKDLNC